MNVKIQDKLIGEFNPDGRKDVEEIKACAKRMIEIINSAEDECSRVRRAVIEEAEMQILSAQMMAVKSLFV